MSKTKSKTTRPVIINRRASHEYFIDDRLECGIVLKGNEIKSLIAGAANINEAYCSIKDGQLVINNMYIAKYDNANKFDVDERRQRILLAHSYEIKRLEAKVAEKDVTLVPLKLFWDRQYVKLEIGICRGKHLYDKRESLKQKDMQREMERMQKY
jgi:SsrA-binding protein